MHKNIEITRSQLPGIDEACRLLKVFAGRGQHLSPRAVNKPLILYGAGSLGVLAKDFFDKIGIPFLYVVDANPERHAGNTAWKGIRILKPEDVSAEHRADCLLAICIATAPYAGIISPLVQQGWMDIVHFYDIAEAYSDRYPLRNGWFTGDISRDDREGIEYTLNRWHDDISRAHHLQFIAWHTFREEYVFDGAPVITDNRFFIPQIISSLHENEIFLDCGAHYGDVSLRFMNTVNHKFKKVYAVEPDKQNLIILHEKLYGRNSASSQQIEIIECALGEKPGTALFYHGLGYASQFSLLGQENVEVNTLDHLDLPATFLKLHLEGWEYDALKGALRNLKKYRPLLATTVYHNRNGLWTVPAFLMQNMENYVFLFRLHSWMGTGAVVYGIPRERYSV